MAILFLENAEYTHGYTVKNSRMQCHIYTHTHLSSRSLSFLTFTLTYLNMLALTHNYIVSYLIKISEST